MISGCVSTPSFVGYQNHQLYMQVANNHLALSGNIVDKKSTNFVSLGLYRYLIKLKNGETVVYEKARTDMAYEFEPSIHRIIKIVFDAKYLVEVYSKALVYAYQIVLADGRILNAVVSQSYDQEISMVYGMSSEKLDKMLKKLNPLARPVPYRHAITLEHEPNPLLSKWTTWKINFVPLVQPLPRFMRF